jgi:hypothetical protein
LLQEILVSGSKAVFEMNGIAARVLIVSAINSDGKATSVKVVR